MDADQPLKTLFRLRARDLLHLIGDSGARVLSAGVLELPAVKRSVDMVLRLRRGRETYLRHVEFEMRHRRGLELRLFEYAARLRVQLRLPVATTVLLLRPPAPRRIQYREVIGRHVVCERHFDVVRLWELDPQQLLARGAGSAALVGGVPSSRPDHVRRAARLIVLTTAPPERNDLLFVLQALCGERYTAKELEELIPREAAMGSGMFTKVFRQARAEGRAEGRAEALRSVCLGIVRDRHPGALAVVAPLVESCESVPRLHAWTQAAYQRPSAEFVKLVTAGEAPRAATTIHRRAPRPARHSPPGRKRRGRATLRRNSKT